MPARRLLRRTTLMSLLAVLTLGVVSVSPARSDPAQQGAWSAPFDVGVVGIHAVLLHTGNVLLFFYGPNQTTDTQAAVWNPTTGQVTDVDPPFGKDYFCAGQSVLPDGRVFVAGGALDGELGSDAGIKQSAIFDPDAGTWTQGPAMSVERWYPTTIELPSGNLLVVSGQVNPNVTSPTIERFDPSNDSLSLLPGSATKNMGLYPRMHLMPGGKLFDSDKSRGSAFFNPATNTWTNGPQLNFRKRPHGSAVLLPNNMNKVMEIGGGSGPPTATTEIIDVSQASPQWHYAASMNTPRKNANAVLLPDGTVLEVGGGNGKGLYSNPVYSAELYDPVANTWSVMASQSVQRTYHSTALLLPDGRVLSAGSDAGNNQTKAEVFSPPYLFKGPRPDISSAPGSLGYGNQFTISTPDAATISRVALIRPGSATHGVDFDERYVDLSFTSSDGAITATSPANANLAPPGWYMLFIVNSNGVPSVAKFVHVG